MEGSACAQFLISLMKGPLNDFTAVPSWNSGAITPGQLQQWLYHQPGERPFISLSKCVQLRVYGLSFRGTNRVTWCPCFSVLQARGHSELSGEACFHFQLKACLNNKLKVANDGASSDFGGSVRQFIIKTTFELVVSTVLALVSTTTGTNRFGNNKHTSACSSFRCSFFMTFNTVK